MGQLRDRMKEDLRLTFRDIFCSRFQSFSPKMFVVVIGDLYGVRGMAA